MRFTPVLYDTDERSFETLGLGRMADLMTCVVTEERNGDYELECTLPMDGASYTKILPDRIIFAMAHKFDTKPQPFRIYYVETDITTKTCTVYARHVCLHKMDYDPVSRMDVTGTPETVFEKIAWCWYNTDLPYTFSSDITTSANFVQTAPRSLKDMLMGDEGSLLDVYGGEYSYDHYGITLHAARGEDRGQVVRYGKNISSMVNVMDESSVVTALMPYWQQTSSDGVLTTVYADPPIVYGTGGETAFPHILPIDCSSYLTVPEGSESEGWKPTSAEVKAWAEAYLATYHNGKIPVSYTVTVVDDPETITGEIHLCDTVLMQHTLLGVNMKAKVVKTVYNCLSDQWDSLEVGTVQSNLAETIKRLNEQQKLQQIAATAYSLPAASATTLGGVKVGDNLTISDGVLSGSYTDYVVEQGTNGIWSYRKWNSGIAECWGTYSATGVNIAKNNYSGFYYSDAVNVALPFTFKSAPTQFVSGGTTSYVSFATPVASTTTQARFWVCCLASGATSVNININISVKGKWK